ncbi:uncharacterized protein LOC130614210 isoform X2 [Hydractinia symbiolongicarpus]|uniref:uncharacterized protein LOC130614210 isoform X2 n=1 Tax=Hydractinia symbiolongicarpus TaxID=13093 RepID=UPI0025516DD4|nr:uncharacterized protein LOC130614210 isoform X2 [Hydractinia symbiolongicarpus]
MMSETKGVVEEKKYKLGSIHTTSSLIMLLNFILLFMDLLLVQIWRTSVSTWLTPELNTAITWYIVSLCGPFCLYLLIYLLKMYFCCHGFTKLFSVSMILNCITWSVLMFISSSYVATHLPDQNCNEKRCTHLRGAVV